jgi:hypothetical protein
MKFNPDITSNLETNTPSVETRELSESEKLAKAKKYWGTRLGGEHRIETPQNDGCEFAIVVPVYRENIERLQKQIDSLRKQSIGQEKFEIIYVINNDVPDGSPKNAEALRKNSEAITALRSIKDLPIRVIDKSSSRNEIKGCTVGKARNRGVAEASLRFYESGKNGVIIQTDADAYFEDADFLKKIHETLQASLDIIGIAGGYIYEFDPDTPDETAISELEQKIAKLILFKKWNLLKKFLADRDGHSSVNDTTFSGVDMISRSFESAVIGGLIDDNSGEDPRFGKDLMKYGKYNNRRVIGMKDDLRVVTAIRESDRTLASFKQIFDAISLDQNTMVQDPAAPSIKEYRQKVRDILSTKPLNRTEAARLVTSPAGEYLIPQTTFEEMLDYVEKHGFQDNDPNLIAWTEKHFGAGTDLAAHVHSLKYPDVELNADLIQQCERLVLLKEGGEQVIANMKKAENEARLKKF